MKELATALVAAQSEMSSVGKDAKNPFFKSNYASLNAVREVALPACNKHGISVLQPMETIDGKQFVKTILLHKSGENLVSMTEVIVKNPTDAQQVGGGISYARRYALMSILCLAADDLDAEDAVGRVGKTTFTAGYIAPVNNETQATVTTTNALPKSKITFNKKAKVDSGDDI